FVFIFGGKNNTSSYPYMSNFRYRMQRITGIIAFFFILYHVMHMHGIIHIEWFRNKVLSPVGLAQFYPYNAASTAAEAMQHPIITLAYVIGVLASVFHFANGIWTMGITWGVWVSPKAQQTASYICSAIGLLVAGAGMSAIIGLWKVDIEEARIKEFEMYENRVKAGIALENPHKLKDYHSEESH
ncbi:MAG: succinate dehydrogenase, partial [Planctomycetota bacterium]